jgi:hypothetical protein
MVHNNMLKRIEPSLSKNLVEELDNLYHDIFVGSKRAKGDLKASNSDAESADSDHQPLKTTKVKKLSEEERRGATETYIDIFLDEALEVKIEDEIIIA